MSYVCDYCLKIVHATVDDPVVVTRRGKLHYECNRKAAAEDQGYQYVPAPAHPEKSKSRAPLSVSHDDTAVQSEAATEKNLNPLERIARRRAMRDGLTEKKQIEDGFIEPVKRRQYTCGKCGVLGHNARKCTAAKSVSP